MFHIPTTDLIPRPKVCTSARRRISRWSRSSSSSGLTITNSVFTISSSNVQRLLAQGLLANAARGSLKELLLPTTSTSSKPFLLIISPGAFSAIHLIVVAIVVNSLLYSLRRHFVSLSSSLFCQFVVVLPWESSRVVESLIRVCTHFSFSRSVSFLHTS